MNTLASLILRRRPMNKRCIYQVFIIVSLMLSISACSQGGSGSGGGIGGSGISNTDITVGTVSGFGSVIISGERFETDSARVFVSGRQAVETELRVGMVVTAAVDLQQGTASRIEYLPQVVGPVDSVNVLTGEFSLLGLSVRYTESTVFDGFDVADIADGVVLEVSGFFDTDGLLSASFIRMDANVSNYFVQGVAREGAAGMTFDFDGFDSLLSGLGIVADFDIPFLDNRRVLVSLPIDSNIPQAGNVVYAAPRIEYSRDQRVALTAHVTAEPENSLFSINSGLTVLVDQNSVLRFADGRPATLNDLTANTLIRLAGSVISTDQLIAAEQIVIRQ